MIKVYTGGIFDILHKGHFLLLEQAKRLGDYLIVGIQADEWVCDIPGKTQPIHSTEERVAQMHALPFADEVIVYESGRSSETLSKVQPHIFVHGSDWQLQADRSAVIEYMHQHGIQMVLLPLIEGISDQDIRKRIIHAEHTHLRKEK